jgi:hypothetical protein
MPRVDRFRLEKFSRSLGRVSEGDEQVGSQDRLEIKARG